MRKIEHLGRANGRGIAKSANTDERNDIRSHHVHPRVEGRGGPACEIRYVNGKLWALTPERSPSLSKHGFTKCPPHKGRRHRLTGHMVVGDSVGGEIGASHSIAI